MGNFIDPKSSPFFWLGSLHRPKRSCGSQVNVADRKLVSHVYQPTSDAQSASPLRNLIIYIKNSYINNFPSALLVLGAQILNIHYEQLLPIAKGVPIGMLFGDVQSGKTRILEAALSLVGTQNTHLLKKCSDNKICSQTTLGVVLDDITDANSIIEKIMFFFDGKPVEIGEDRIKPRTSFLASANMECFQSLAKHYRFVAII